LQDGNQGLETAAKGHRLLSGGRLLFEHCSAACGDRNREAFALIVGDVPGFANAPLW
jgi:hypothetical protein